MKKKENGRAIIWKCILYILCIMLLFAILLIWDRIFSPNLDSCLISKLTSVIKEWGTVRDFVRKFRESGIYNALFVAAHDEEDTLAPLQYLIELAGIVNVLFAVINEQLSIRRYGMLMRDVADDMFPFHLIIQLPLHTAFAVIGSYSCRKNIGLAASICFLGVLFCFSYSCYLLWCLYLSRKRRTENIRKFIEEITLSTDNRTQTHLLTLDYAQYLGKQWNDGVSAQIYRNEKYFTDNYLISLVQRDSASNKKRNLHTENKNNIFELSPFKKCINGYFPGVFSYIGKEHDYLLLVDGLYLADQTMEADIRLDIYIRNFYDDVQKCQQIWDVLFGQVQDKTHHARLAYSILHNAFQQDQDVFVILALGLLHYLNIARLEITPNDISFISEKIDFLLEILNIHMTSGAKGKLFSLGWYEVVIISCGMLQWLVAIEPSQQELYEWSRKLLVHFHNHYLSQMNRERIDANIDFYTSLAYIMFGLENRQIQNHLPASFLISIFSSVSKALVL